MADNCSDQGTGQSLDSDLVQSQYMCSEALSASAILRFLRFSLYMLRPYTIADFELNNKHHDLQMNYCIDSLKLCDLSNFTC